MQFRSYFSVSRTVFLILLFLFLTLGAAIPTYALEGIKLVIDGETIKTQPAPLIVSDRTMIPVRLVSEKLGARVTWNEESRTVLIIKGDRSVQLRIDSRLVEFKGGETPFNICDVPPQIIEDRTFVPLRIVSNALGVSIGWEGKSRTVSVDSSIPAPYTPFFDMTISSLKSGQIISGTTVLQSAFPGGIPAEAAEIRYYLLDPATGKGFVIARGSNITGRYTWLPELANYDLRIISAVLYDEKGRFLAGKAVPVQIAISPQVILSGLTQGQSIGNSVSLGAQVNFSAKYVKYEIGNQDTGKVTVSPESDPQGTFNWSPQLEDNGTTSVRLIAYDQLNKPYYSQPFLVTVAVARNHELKGVSTGDSVNKPVTLWISRNYPISEVQYILRDSLSGREEILAQYPQYSSYRWFPGPEQAGAKELIARVKDATGNSYETNKINVGVVGNPLLLMETIGPKQVLTGTVKLKSLSNVSLNSLEYWLIHPRTGEKRSIASGSDPNIEYAWTPGQGDGGDWIIQAIGTMATGAKITSEHIPVKVYLGKTYSSQPIIEKSKFLDLVSGLAVQSRQKTGMSAALQAAQAILETGWGQSSPVDKYSGRISYNLFGIKGQGPAGTVISNTWEEYNGNTFRIDAQFRAYHNVNESWLDHKNLLLKASRYEPYRIVMHNSTQGAWALRRAGYATDSKYPLKLMDIINRYNLQKLDEVEI